MQAKTRRVLTMAALLAVVLTRQAMAVQEVCTTTALTPGPAETVVCQITNAYEYGSFTIVRAAVIDATGTPMMRGAPLWSIPSRRCSMRLRRRPHTLPTSAG